MCYAKCLQQNHRIAPFAFAMRQDLASPLQGIQATGRELMAQPALAVIQQMYQLPQLMRPAAPARWVAGQKAVALQ